MRYGEIQHPSHPDHKLKLEHKGTPYTCDGCLEPGFGIRYTCEEESCYFHLHKDCATPEDIIYHPFFPECKFKFLQSGKPNRYCDACGKDIEGYVYHCFWCGKDLHPCCANLPWTIEEGDVKLELKKVSSKCDNCGRKKLRGGMRTWSYVSKCKEYHIHVGCVKEMLLESWEKESLIDNKGVGEGKVEQNYSLQLQRRVPTLEITEQKDGKGKKATGRYAKLKKILKTVLGIIIGVMLGDPTSIAVAAITSLVT